MAHISRRMALAVGLVAAVTALLPVPATAQSIFVDNRNGSNANDGLTPVPTGLTSGPVKTILRAVQLAGPGATIHVANTGVPYYEAVRLNGSRHSGSPFVRFTILGNGAVISGARFVPPAAWKEVSEGLWRFTPWRKGFYQLLLDGQPVPEVPVPIVARALPELAAGQWCAWQGSIWYRASLGDPPADLPLWYAADEVGLTLYDLSHVHIQDLTLEHFRLDGVNAHDRATDVVLENVVCRGNARAGLAVGGTSSVTVRGCDLSGNRRHSLLIGELGSADLVETNLDRPATIAP